MAFTLRFFLLFIFATEFICAQTNTIIDSLKKELLIAKHDTTRCAILIILSEKEADELSEEHNRELKQVAEVGIKRNDQFKKKYQNALATSLYNTGYIQRHKGQLSKAIEYFNLSLKISAEIDDKAGIASCYSGIGNANYDQGNYTIALKYYNLCLQIGEELNDKELVAVSYLSIAQVHRIKSNMLLALDYYTKGLKTSEAIGNKYMAAYAINNIGLVYQDQGDIANAIDYFSKALKSFESLGDKTATAMCLTNLGWMHYKKGDLTKALTCYEKGLRIAEEIDSKIEISTALSAIAEIYVDWGKYSTAMEYYEKSLRIFEEMNDKRGIAIYHAKMAKIYFKTKNNAKALFHATVAKKMSNELGIVETLSSATFLLSDIYKASGNSQLALENYELHIKMRDSISNDANRKAALKNNLQYEYDKKELSIKAEQDKKDLITQASIQRKNKLAIISGAAAIILALGIGIVFLFYRQNKIQSTQKALKLEQKLLRLQMNPHFIFNSLTIIQSFINADKKQEAGTYLSKISKLIRSTLENSREEYLSFDEELKSLENYLSVNQLVADNKFQFSIEVDSTIDQESTQVPPMMAQPFIENAIKHGIANNTTNPKIIVRFKKSANGILFEVEDNGSGLQAKELNEQKKHNSLATIITKERLANILKKSVDTININIEELIDASGKVAGTKSAFELPTKIV